MIEESEEEQDAGIKRRKRKIKRYIFDYIEVMTAGLRDQAILYLQLSSGMGA